MRVARSRVLVAEGYALAAVARVAGISWQALYRTPKPKTAPQRRPPAEGSVERGIVETAKENPTDGYRMVWALTVRKLGVAINRKRVLRVMRRHGLIRRRRSEPRRRRPGFFRVERPAQLWHMDMTAVWVAEHGWCYLNAIIDCCTREIVGWGAGGPLPGGRGDRGRRAGRCRAAGPAREADARHGQRPGVHGPGLQARPVGPPGLVEGLELVARRSAP
jgi:transposase InsO family protein